VKYRDDDVHADAVRVAYLWLPPTGVPGEAAPLVQVAETLDKRARLATEIIKGVIVPQFVVLPLAVLLVWFALARGIKPLNELQQRIRRRESQDLSPLDERDVPEEVAPLVSAINDLLGRLDQSMRTQKHFLADAAHQLKTPLAGLRMQAELAQREIDAGQQDPKALKRALQYIAHSTERAAHMVNQLLAMARAEDKELARRPSRWTWPRWRVKRCATSCPRRMDKRIDLGYEGPDDGQSLNGTRPDGPAAAGARAGAQPGGQRAAVHARPAARSQCGWWTTRSARWWCCRWRTPAPASPRPSASWCCSRSTGRWAPTSMAAAWGWRSSTRSCERHGADLRSPMRRPRGSAAAQGMGPGHCSRCGLR
jgi:hypothetical protein